MKSYFASALFLVGASALGAPALAADPMGSAPAAPAEQTSPGAGMTKDQIVGRPIVDKTGAKVGTVKDVRTDAQGAATDLVVSVGNKDVLLPASEVKVASNDTIQTSKSAKDVKRLPAAESGAAGSTSMGTKPGTGAGTPDGMSPAPSPAAPY